MRGRLSILAKSLIGLLALLASAAAAAQLAGDCGDPFHNQGGVGYGPFDYRTATQSQRSLVEGAHFTPGVESLQSGITGSLGAEIDYTLRAFPNHPRALMSMIRLAQRERTNQPKGAHYTVDCYLDRATRYQPDDMEVRLLRGIYFSMNRKYDAAITDFKAVLEAAPNNANAHYNLGLAYYELKQYDKALEEAHLAKSLGFPLEGLKHLLTTIGKWED